jgi:scyllo-inositol 2-dehydrogenase (NAD+)
LAGIATRTPGRAELILAALAAGTRALHIEKPLCNSVAEWSRLRAAFAASDVFVTYGTIRRLMAPYRQALELVESGRLGALRQVHVSFGSGRLFWSHPHSIDLILWAAGRRTVTTVQSVLAEVELSSSRTVVQNDPIVRSAVIQFEDGLIGLISQTPGADFILSCDDGNVTVRADGAGVEVSAPRDDDVYLTREECPPNTPNEPMMTGTLAAVAQLVSCLRSRPDAIAANHTAKIDILRGQQLAFAIVQSHLEGGRPVSPEAVDASLEIRGRTGDRSA